MLNFVPKFKVMGLNIKSAIRKQGLTSKELADRLGISKVTLSYQINGNPTIETLEKIATALNVDVVELFDAPGQTSSQALKCPKCGANIKINIELN